MLAFLVFVSIRLSQFREGAPGLAVWLFLLELVGGVALSIVPKRLVKSVCWNAPKRHNKKPGQ